MRRCAVIIGVNNTGSMDTLGGAVHGAKEFKAWAESQKITCEILIDEAGNKVRLADIYDTVEAFVEAKIYHQMIIYFAGHGILKSPTEELWLLSNAPDNPNEAVNLATSKLLAKHAGIPHVVFFSDACRNSPGDNVDVAMVSGGQIFPNKVKYNQGDSSVDVFYASRLGSVAHERKPDATSPVHKGIFTECVLRGLRGEVREILSMSEPGPGSVTRIFAPPLRDYLKDAVPREVAKYGYRKNQIPDADIQSGDPQYLAQHKGSFFTFGEDDPKPERPAEDLETVITSDVKRSADEILMADDRARPMHAEGFYLIGDIDSIDEHIRFSQTFGERFSFTLRPPAHSQYQGTFLLKFKNGQSTPIAVLPGFYGTVLIRDSAVVNISYSPVLGSARREQMQYRNLGLPRLKAMVAAAAQHGRDWLNRGPEELHRLASDVRYAKTYDPTLGLFAAYAYAEAGDFNSAKSVYTYMRREPEPVLFDVAMLARFSNERDEQYELNKKTIVAPICPMMTLGWSYMKIQGLELPTQIRALLPFLVPGLWTTFSPIGTRVFESLMTSYKK